MFFVNHNRQLLFDFVWLYVYKNNGTEFEHFYNEPWTDDGWWDVQVLCFMSELPAYTNINFFLYLHQSCLLPVLKAAPFCFILYADKTRLLSHGTAKAYPVIV
jgi:hypothetical protein